MSKFFYALALLLAFPSAHGASVLICNLSEIAQASCIPTTNPSPADKVFVANDPTIGSGKVTDFKNFTLKDYGPVGLDDLVGVCTNSIPTWTNCAKEWERKRYLPNNTVTAPPPTFTPRKYKCSPAKDEEIRYRAEGKAGVIQWYCNQPDAIYREVFCGNPDNLPRGVLKLRFAMLAAFLFSKQSRECTAEEDALSDKLDAEEGPKIFVSPITSGTRPVFERTAQNTKGADTKLNVPQNQPCGSWHLQDAYGKPTNYFEVVAGGRNKVYALCTVQGAISK